MMMFGRHRMIRLGLTDMCRSVCTLIIHVRSTWVAWAPWVWLVAIGLFIFWSEGQVGQMG
jgi:hypothetical protein